MTRRLNRRGISTTTQRALFPPDLEEQGGALASHTQDANAPLLIKRVERAAWQDCHVSLDLRGEISQYATSTQALDLLLTEHVIDNQINIERQANGLEPIVLSYVLPDDLTPETRPGIADFARLDLHKHLKGLTPAQKNALDRLAQSKPSFCSDISYEEEWPEMGEVTLLPIVTIEGTPGTIDPLLAQTRHHLKELLGQGLPGINKNLTQQIITFVSESAANVRDHSGGVLGNSKGYIAANRTWRRYRDRRRSQWVEIYRTYLSCYDFGRGVFAALAAVPAYAEIFAQYPEMEHGVVALKLAARPGVTSMMDVEGRGAGLPRMIDIIRHLPEVSKGTNCTYRGGLKIISHGAVLDFLTTSDCTSYDCILPGTQLQLSFEAVRRTNHLGGF
jgi:hypothetical protein